MGVSWEQRAAVLGTESSCAGSFSLPVAVSASSGAPRASWGQDRDMGTSLLSSLRCQGHTPWRAEGCWLQYKIGVRAAGRELREIMQMLLPWQAEEAGKYLLPMLPWQKMPHHFWWWWLVLAERKEEHPFYKSVWINNLYVTRFNHVSLHARRSNDRSYFFPLLSPILLQELCKSDSKASHAETIMHRENFYAQHLFKSNLLTLAKDDLSPSFSRMTIVLPSIIELCLKQICIITKTQLQLKKKAPPFQKKKQKKVKPQLTSFVTNPGYSDKHAGED